MKKKMMLVAAAGTLLLVILAPFQLWGAVPELISFQGKLLEDGVPVNGSRAMRFSLWDSEVGGDVTDALWHETYDSPDPLVEILGGVYNVKLGTLATLPDDLTTHDSLYLQVEVFHPDEATWQKLEPLLEITSTVFALKAAVSDNAETLDGMDSLDFAKNFHGHTFSDLTGSATDAQIPDNITINFAARAGDADTLQGNPPSAFAAAVHNHDQRYYTESELSTSGGGGHVHWTNLTGVPPGFADGTDNDSGGDITGVVAGTALTGGGSAGNVILNVAFGGNGSAAMVSHSDHNHWRANWSGSGVGLTLNSSNSDGIRLSAGTNGLTVSSAGADGLYVDSAGANGIYVNSAAFEGVSVQSAGSPSTTTPSSEKNGFGVAGAEGHGLYVGRADFDGVRVVSAARNGVNVVSAGTPSTMTPSSSAKNGLEVAGAEGHGLYVGRADLAGVYVESAGYDGLVVKSAGSPSTTRLSMERNGFEVGGASGYGLWVGSADRDGVYVDSAGVSGMVVMSAADDGFGVLSAGRDGVFVGSAGTPSTTTPSSEKNGLEVAGAEKYGLYVGRADGSGVYVQSAEEYGGYFFADGYKGRGVYAETSGDNSIGVYGKATGANSTGVWGEGVNFDFYAAGPGGNYGPFTGAHEVRFAQDMPGMIRPGMIVSSTGKVAARETEDGGISLSSSLPTVTITRKARDKAVLGVLVSEGPLNEGHWYEAREDERFGVVNALGEGRMWVCDSNGDIEAGDYITSSSVPGYGQRQDDDLVHSYTVGKAIETVDWDAVTETVEYDGKEYKLYLIAVVYTSG